MWKYKIYKRPKVRWYGTGIVRYRYRWYRYIDIPINFTNVNKHTEIISCWVFIQFDSYKNRLLIQSKILNDIYIYIYITMSYISNLCEV